MDKIMTARTMAGRIGTYVLIADLQKVLLKDAYSLQKAGQDSAGEYADLMAKKLEEIRSE